MIKGLGIDVIDIKRLIDGYNNFGDRFLEKIFSAEEIEYCNLYKNKFEHFAGKFAVKEAFMKAIGAGIRQGIWFRDIETLNTTEQKPYVNLYNKAKKIYESIGSPTIHISITHTDNTAAAVLILES